jgi:hypothetical protein
MPAEWVFTGFTYVTDVKTEDRREVYNVSVFPPLQSGPVSLSLVGPTKSCPRKA